jgi:hypothetical protein
MNAQIKKLNMEIEIAKINGSHIPGLEYSLRGWVQEKGECFGFGFPLTKEEAASENIDELIKRQCEPGKWGLSEGAVKIIPKIISDCRQQQKTLFECYASREENPEGGEEEVKAAKGFVVAKSRY